MTRLTRRDLLLTFLGPAVASACRSAKPPSLPFEGAILGGNDRVGHLLRAGFEDYRILELDTEPGGTARGGHNTITAFPWGAHYLPCPQPHARSVELLALEMGAAERD